MVEFKDIAEYLPFVGAAIAGARTENTTFKKGIPPALVARFLELAFAGGVMYSAYSTDMQAMRNSIEQLRGNVIEVRAVADKVLVLSQKLETTAAEQAKLAEELREIKRDLYRPKVGGK